VTGEAADPAPVLRFFGALLAHGSAPLAGCPLAGAQLEALGLQPRGDEVVLPADWDPLVAADIRAGLGNGAAAWLTRLDVYPAIGSTNAELTSRAGFESIAGHVCLAEVQLAGRGRRGRSWQSPLGGNLALSLGFAPPRPLPELGALSLVVGLAVLDALEGSGTEGLALKWPNDVLLHGAKLGGILMELVSAPGGAAVVVGVGINLRLPPAARLGIEQAVADLASALAVLPRRSHLAARLIDCIVTFTRGFADSGFAPFVSEFDRRHACQDAEVLIVQGDRSMEARVLGVAQDGGLRILTRDGERTVHGGEVSLRVRPAGAR
jgi:BirA family biotin operon repressor/biotin-[acetyl-CoA-carboxylase] ligase